MCKVLDAWKKKFFFLIRSSVVTLKFNLFKCVSHRACQLPASLLRIEMESSANLFQSDWLSWLSLEESLLPRWNSMEDRNDEKKVAQCAHEYIVKYNQIIGRSVPQHHVAFVYAMTTHYSLWIWFIYTQASLSRRHTARVRKLCAIYESLECLLPKFIECASHGKWVQNCHIKESIKLKGIYRLSRLFRLFFLFSFLAFCFQLRNLWQTEALT